MNLVFPHEWFVLLFEGLKPLTVSAFTFLKSYPFSRGEVSYHTEDAQRRKQKRYFLRGFDELF